MDYDQAFKSETLALPDGLTYNSNARLLHITENGVEEVRKYPFPVDIKHKLLKASHELESKVSSGQLTVEQAVSESKTYIKLNNWSRDFALQKIEELKNGGMVAGDPWYMFFDITTEDDYRRVVDTLDKDNISSVDSLSAFLNTPKEKIRKLGSELAVKDYAYHFPGTVERMYRSFTLASTKHDWSINKTQFNSNKQAVVRFINPMGNDTEESFMLKSEKGPEKANSLYLERAMLNNLRYIESGKAIVLNRKLIPTLDGVMRPILVNVKSPMKVADIAVSYMPTLQACSLIDFDSEGMEDVVGKEKLEEINKKTYTKAAFRRNESKNNYPALKSFKKYLETVKAEMSKAADIFPSYRQPAFNESEDNFSKASYMFSIAASHLFTSKYFKDEKKKVGVLPKPNFEDIGVLKLTETGKRLLEGTSPVAPYVPIDWIFLKR